ncbi:hypothetical protein BX070DRAFT_226752, partial [Coemansia spiralis]
MYAVFIAVVLFKLLISIFCALFFLYCSAFCFRLRLPHTLLLHTLLPRIPHPLFHDFSHKFLFLPVVSPVASFPCFSSCFIPPPCFFFRILCFTFFFLF